MEGEFGERLIQFENHVSGTDPFTIPETTARANWYGVSGIPHVRIDGRYSVVGAGSCGSAASAYRTYINQRLAINGGISPLQIEGSFMPSATDISATATFRLQDPATLTSLRATLLVYEDNVFWCCGYGGVNIWDRTTRAIYDEYVSLVDVGDEVTISHMFIHNGAWNPEELHVVAYLQTTSGWKEIHQGALLPVVQDFTFELDHFVRSVPDANGTAVFDAVLTNISEASDTFTLEPATPFGDWTLDFLVCGDTNPHSAPVQVVLDPGGTCAVQIRVHTNDAVEIRPGGFNVTSMATARTQVNSMRVFNGSYSVFLCDDDYTNSDEASIVAALDDLGYLYEDWDVYNGHNNLSPMFVNLSGFDYVIWQTGFRFTQLLSDNDMNALMQYMDNGGALFLTSQEFLDSQGGANTFINDYLGVDSWTLDTRFTQMNGVAGDPIGDGLSLTLSFNIPAFNQGDSAVPGATGATSFFAPDGSHALVRNEMAGGVKSVFMPGAFNAIVNNGPLPNNPTVLLERILDWLVPQSPADVIDGVGARMASRIEGVRPNPFNPRTEIAFTLSPVGAADAVDLEVFDLTGRKVATILRGQMVPGRHTATWTGRSDVGTPAESGVYFVRLTTREGKSREKLILLK